MLDPVSAARIPRRMQWSPSHTSRRRVQATLCAVTIGGAWDVALIIPPACT
jgi:hypothetical protein